MAASKSKSKAQSKRGGKRPGAGRKTQAETALRRDYNAASTELLVGYLPSVLANLKALADGVKVLAADGVTAYDQAPSVQANIYLCDRLLG